MWVVGGWEKRLPVCNGWLLPHTPAALFANSVIDIIVAGPPSTILQAHRLCKIIIVISSTPVLTWLSKLERMQSCWWSDAQCGRVMHTGVEWCTLGCSSTTWRCRTFPLPTTQSAACNILSGCNTECKVTINNIILIIVIIIITAARVFLMLSLWEQGGGVVKRACNPSQPVQSLESQFSATFLQIHSFHHPPCPALVTLILWPPTSHENVLA